MLELYLISRLDAISSIMLLIFIISSIPVILCGIFKLLILADNGSIEELKDGEWAPIYALIKRFKLWVIIMIISVLGVTLIPSTKDAYIIYGGGTVIDYVKKDSTTKQIPHKAIVALDKYLDSLEEDKENNN